MRQTSKMSPHFDGNARKRFPFTAVDELFYSILFHFQNAVAIFHLSAALPCEACFFQLYEMTVLRIISAG